MITLKDYQTRVLDSPGDFFRIAAREQNPERAFQEITGRIFGTPTPYIPVKGEHLYAEAEEKRAVGAVWESRSNGKCLFVMPEGKDLDKIRQAIK